jgi:hypothetical protein
MKRRILLTTIIFAFCGLCLLTLQSSVPQPGYSTARVFWYSGLTCDCDFVVSGSVVGGGTATESFTATIEGAEGNTYPHKDYVLEHGYISGTITRDFWYSEWTSPTTQVWYHIVDSKTINKAWDELFDVIMDMGIAKEANAQPIED